MTPIPISGLEIASDFVGLSVVMPEEKLVPEIRLYQTTYVLKSDFHVTLIGRGHLFAQKLAREKDIALRAAEALSEELFQEASDGLDFKVHLVPPFFKVKKRYSVPLMHSRKSVIMRCVVDQSVLFYDRLAQLSNISLSTVPHHVTLYTPNNELDQKGIGIGTFREFLAYASEIKSSLGMKF